MIDMDTRAIRVKRFSLPPMELPLVRLQENSLCLHLSAPITLHWKNRGHFKGQALTPGSVCLYAAGATREHRWHVPIEVLCLDLPQALVSQVAQEEYGEESRELICCRGVADRQIYHLAVLLDNDRQAGHPSGSMFTESVSIALTAHVLRHYSAMGTPARSVRGGLSARSLKAAEEFIQANLDSDLRLTTVADAIGLSVYHFARRFKQSKGLSPHQYVIRQRVEKAKTLLLRGEVTVAQAAAEVGFADQSHLALHMKRLLGVSPSQIRR